MQAKCVVNWAEHLVYPEETEFHDNSKESINGRALVQAEWWGGVKSAGSLIKKKQSSFLSLQHKSYSRRVFARATADTTHGCADKQICTLKQIESSLDYTVEAFHSDKVVCAVLNVNRQT